MSSPNSLPNAERLVDRSALLAQVHASPYWDLVVIGGGATGLGCAVDASARGHSVLLLEAQDFGKGTSSRATKLIHGGVRYLAQGRIGLVREALLERSRLLANAPHLVYPLRFVIPAYQWMDRLRFSAGLWCYDLLAGSRGIAPCRFLAAKEVIAAAPTIDRAGLKGGVAYWDAQFDDAALAIALMRTVLDLGGVAINYAPVEQLVVEAGKVVGVKARDAETGCHFEARAKVVINATGVWADRVRRMERPSAPALLRPSQGVHLVIGRHFLPGNDAVLIPGMPDGRVLFLVPWQDKVVVGTTDTLRNDLPMEPMPLAGEVDMILESASRYLAAPLRREDVSSVFVGLRPLLDGGAARSAGLSREHLVETSAGGMVTITGGKWTTYRKMAEETVDAAESAGALDHVRCPTANLPLHGASAGRKAEVLTPDEARVRYAVRHELARTVEDVLARRCRTLFLDAALAGDAAPDVARVLAEELGRDAEWQTREIAAFRALAQGYRSNAGTG